MMMNARPVVLRWLLLLFCDVRRLLRLEPSLLLPRPTVTRSCHRCSRRFLLLLLLLLVQTFYLIFQTYRLRQRDWEKWEEPFILSRIRFFPWNRIDFVFFFQSNFTIVKMRFLFNFVSSMMGDQRNNGPTPPPIRQTLPIERRWTNRRRWSHWHHPGLCWPHIGRPLTSGGEWGGRPPTDTHIDGRRRSYRHTAAASG